MIFFINQLIFNASLSEDIFLETENAVSGGHVYIFVAIYFLEKFIFF